MAIVLRVWRLDQFPPGLSVDEAYNLLDAQRILDGARPLFLPDNAGREALYSYWQAAVITVVGSGPLALRIASAMIGIITVILTVWCLSALPWPHARLTAIVTAAILAGLFWHTLFSRFGIRAISLPLVETLVFGWLWRGIFSGRARPFALAGLALGIAVYTGTAARVLPLAPIASVVLLAWLDRARTMFLLRGLALMLGVAAIVILPLAVYFWTYPNQFTTHLGEVAVGPAELLANVPRVLGMFTWRGDSAWWRNLADRPVFDPLMAVLFIAGLLIFLRDLWRLEIRDWRLVLNLQSSIFNLQSSIFSLQSSVFNPQSSIFNPQSSVSSLFILFWLGVMLIPTLAADNAPNFSRAIGILPVVCVIPARALVAGWQWVSQRRPRLASAALGAPLLISLVWTTWDYFVVFANRPEPYYAYDADKVAAGRVLRAASETSVVYATPDLVGHATVRATTQDVDVRAYDPERGLVLADGGSSLFVWRRPAASETPAEGGGQGGQALLSLGAERREIADDQGRPLLVGFRLPAQPPDVVRDTLGLRPGQVRFGGIIGLSGYRLGGAPMTGNGNDIARPSAVTLMWAALTPIERDLTLFVHFIDATGQTIAQADGEPVGATHPTTRWRVGERIIEWRSPDRLPPGRYRVRVGWYDRQTGERLSLPGSTDNAQDLGDFQMP